MNKWIIKYVTNPLWEFGARRKRLPILRELERTQYWPLKTLAELQNYRLRKLIEHAYAHVPYYTELFDRLTLKPADIQTVEDLQKLPILTKQMVADNFEKLKANNIDKYRPKYYSTGGTSGRHLHFYNAQLTFDAHMASIFRAWRWIGWDFGEKYAYIWGASMDLKEEKTLKKKTKDFFTENRIFVQALMFTDETLERDCKRLITFQPAYIMSYPSTLIVFAKYMQKNNMTLKVKGISTTSEKLYSWQREIIERFFECKVFDDYGGRESAVRASQCEKGNYHIAVENGVLETIQNDKNVIGKPGRVLLTEFRNYAMPFIRYENTDVAVLSNKTCSCNRTLPLLEDIHGRTSDIFVTTDGKYIPAQYFMVAFLEFSGEYYQIIQETKHELRIKIVKGKHFTDSNLENIKKILRKWIGHKTRIDFEFVKDIPVTSSGKRRYFISKVPLEF